MKKILTIVLVLIMVCALTACGKSASSVKVEANAKPPTAGEKSKQQVLATNHAQGKTLVVYFSRWGNTDFENNLDASTSASIVITGNKIEGTTEVVANMIQDIVGGDKHLIETAQNYPRDFDTLILQARQERQAGFKPVLKSKIKDIAQYDTIFIGFPNWGTTLPNPILTFLSEYDLSGKTIIPFCTHDGYGSGRSFSDFGALAPNSKLLEGIAINAKQVQSARGEIQEWLKDIGISKNNNISNVTATTISIGEQTIRGELYNNDLAQNFIKMLPQTITMRRFGDREYYGGIAQRITTKVPGQLSFSDGDITYCPTNNTIAIFFAQTDKPHLTMSVIPIGKVTSDLSVFQNMPNNVEVIFKIAP